MTETTQGLLERLVVALERIASSVPASPVISSHRFPDEMPIIDFVSVLKETTKNGVWSRVAGLCHADNITTVGQLREAFPTIHRAPNIGLYTTSIVGELLRKTS